MIFKLNEKTNEINKSLNKAAMPKSTEAIEVFSNLNSRSDKIQKQVELVTNGTQKLLDNANNALENLNRANKSISGKMLFFIKHNLEIADLSVVLFFLFRPIRF